MNKGWDVKSDFKLSSKKSRNKRSKKNSKRSKDHLPIPISHKSFRK